MPSKELKAGGNTIPRGRYVKLQSMLLNIPEDKRDMVAKPDGEVYSWVYTKVRAVVSKLGNEIVAVLREISRELNEFILRFNNRFKPAGIAVDHEGLRDLAKLILATKFS